jgi:hypothetical protein
VHRSISPWLATPRSLLAADEVVKKMGFVSAEAIRLTATFCRRWDCHGCLPLRPLEEAVCTMSQHRQRGSFDQHEWSRMGG